MQSVLKTVGPNKGRFLRAPIFPCSGSVVPFGLYPAFAAPLMAGESVQLVNLRGTMISQPLANPLSGGWLEAWIASVPISGLDKSDPQTGTWKGLVNDVTPVTTGLTAAAQDVQFFTNVGQIDFIKQAYDLLVSEFFQAPGTTAPTGLDGNVVSLPVVGSDWAQNLQVIPATATVATWPEKSVSVDLVGMDLDTERTLVEAENYREWVQEYGVGDPEPKTYGGPRIHRYFRQWVQPSNTIDPSNGVPRASHVFAYRLGLRKGFVVREPSILLVLWTYRPQTFRRSFLGSYIGRMSGLKEWVPPRGNAAWSTINGDDPLFPATFDTGAPASDYAFDRSDIWAMGETFINRADASNPYPPPSVGAGITNADTASMRSRYPTLAEVKALFSTSTTVADYCAYYSALGGLRAAGQVKEVANL